MVFFTPDNNTGVYRCAKSNTGGGTGVCKKHRVRVFAKKHPGTKTPSTPRTGVYPSIFYQNTIKHCTGVHLVNYLTVLIYPPGVCKKHRVPVFAKKHPWTKYTGVNTTSKVLVFTPVYFTKTPSNTVPVFTW